MIIPFFHYTCLDNLPSILLNARLISRSELNRNLKKFSDVSIDPFQLAREKRKLLRYIPLFAGFYTMWNNELTDCLGKKYGNPQFQNKSFYGALNKTLQTKMGSSYEKIVILLVNNELIYEFADQGKIRFFTDIAIKSESNEIPIGNRQDLENCLRDRIDGANISGEIDVFDDGKKSIECMSDIEAVIVDNQRIKAQVADVVAQYNTKGAAPLILEKELPRNPLPGLARVTEAQKTFANYVENLKQNGITGETYREKIAQWKREHPE